MAQTPRDPPRSYQAFRAQLLAIYAEVDQLAVGCDGATQCCRFGVTGREPHPTAIEMEEVKLAVRASGGRVPKAEGSDCPFLVGSRCSIYAHRPFGCRTYYCDKAHAKVPRAEFQRLGRAVLALSEKFNPKDPGARPLRRAL